MQTPSGHPPIGERWNSIQSWLFPVREDEIGALDEKHRQWVAVCELCGELGVRPSESERRRSATVTDRQASA